MFQYQENQLVDVDTLENKYPVHFVFIRATVGNDRLISNLMKIGVAPKQPYSGSLSLLSSQRKFTRTGALY
jgi:hypothetical protein